MNGRRLFVSLGVLLASLALPLAPAQAATSQVIVQGGTTIVDSGLFDHVIAPGFAAAYPQYSLTFVAVGTGAALINAENGGGDAVFTHNPSAEATFVAGGYSYEPIGRSIMVSDFITVGPLSDPAGVNASDPHDVVHAFEAIAAAGTAGQADFVSRGDASGTNAKELSIWSLVHTDNPAIQLNTLGEPGPSGGTADYAWYHKTGLGQADNLQQANQCPTGTFPSGKCYTIADRGTFNFLVGNGAITALKLVSDQNNAVGAIGGSSLLVNPYHAYAVNPTKVPTVNGRPTNVQGAEAFLNYLTSPGFQSQVGQYPDAINPAFTPDARPTISITQGLPKSTAGGQQVTMTGGVHPNFYLSPQMFGAEVDLWLGGLGGTRVAYDNLDANGAFTFNFKPTRNGSYTIGFPAFQDRQSTSLSAGFMSVKAAVTMSVVSKSGHTVNLSGTAQPSTGRTNAKLAIMYRRVGGTFSTAKTLSLANGVLNWTTSITLPAGGAWVLKAVYTDKGVVTSGSSPLVHVSV